MLINIRGTNGSGKTTVARELLRRAPARPIYNILGSRMAEAYELSVIKSAPCFLIGPYLTGTGGCDSIHPYDTVIQLIDKYQRQGHVIFEGVLVASCYGRIGAMLEQWGKQGVIVALDTTLEECISRVNARRGDRPNLNPKQLTAKFHTVQRIVDKCRTAGIIRVEVTSVERCPDLIIQMMEETPWNADGLPHLSLPGPEKGKPSAAAKKQALRGPGQQTLF